jgi:flagellin-like protein
MKEEGVSPVIGSILMVAITIVLVASLYIFVFSNLVSAPYTTAQFASTLVVDYDHSNTRNLNITVSMSNPNSVSMSLVKIGIMHEGNYTMLSYDSDKGIWSNQTNNDKWHYEAKLSDINGNSEIDSGDVFYIYLVDDDPSDRVVPAEFTSGDKIVLSAQGYNGNAEVILHF